jgi:hypothetical protein
MFIQDELKIPEKSGLYNIEESGPSVSDVSAYGTD